ncbi:MAG: tRNA uridine-5-carboxymethylaminomethyl(34) synthesis GTPase MnmE [Bacteroidaceae bacterium]|nr:tRNA uridine-5-carboxymethylaminomethyl(34) synthesis GTPase MnmE [Bacteroidaceae bacterium]
MNDTICALATATGGAIGIIRISGPQSLEILSRVFRGKGDVQTYPANTIHYGHIVEYDAVSQRQIPIDEVMVSIFRSPHSYTGEDSAEISCHGSRYIINKVLELLVQAGCRMANPGEYTMRAYLNGKMDLSQAEAVADLIASTNKATHQMAMSQLRGGISTELGRLREQLLKLTSLLELELDFSDHEDLEFADRSELLELTKTIDNHITNLARSFETGQALKQGIPVAIVGKTNVGKSTLLNALLKDDRAIVSDIHGTTRDTIEETMDINGIQFRFIDTAGLRKTNDEVEQIGIERTIRKIKQARIVIWLLDQRPTWSEMDEMDELSKGKKCIYVHNKADLIDIHKFNPYILPLSMISAKNGNGVSNLKQRIFEEAERAGLTTNSNEIIVTNARHYDALTRAHEHLERVLYGLQQQLSGDLLSEDLRLTLNTLAEITGGQITPNEVLGNIFKTFCIGK